MRKLTDPHGRHIHKLRLALLDACNFRCHYCMPDNPKFMAANKLISRENILKLSTTLTGLGIDEIRLTGGEPTLRSDFMDIVRDLSDLPLNKLGITTNGHRFKRFIPELRDTKCRHLNFSLDSLNKAGFYEMTKTNHLESVLEGILTAKEYGFEVKLNMVLMRGINDHEVEDFIDFSSRFGVEVRFLELMKIGQALDKFEKHFISADEVISGINKKYELFHDERPIDSTSFNYNLENGANIGFIASESKPFCNGCSRLRLSATGTLRPCLMMSEGYSLINKSDLEVEELLHKTMALKPVDRIEDVAESMYMIGG